MARLLTFVIVLLTAAVLLFGCTPKTEAEAGTEGTVSNSTDEAPPTATGMKSPGMDDEGDAEDDDPPGHADDDDPAGHDDDEDDDTKPTSASKDSGMTLAVYKNAKGEVACPVMGGAIDPEKAVGYADHNGKRYYFCCDGCPEVFEKNKDKYAK